MASHNISYKCNFFVTIVRLVNGDPTYYGAVFTSKGVRNGPVCADGFDENDASKHINLFGIYILELCYGQIYNILLTTSEANLIECYICVQELQSSIPVMSHVPKTI